MDGEESKVNPANSHPPNSIYAAATAESKKTIQEFKQQASNSNAESNQTIEEFKQSAPESDDHEVNEAFVVGGALVDVVITR